MILGKWTSQGILNEINWCFLTWVINVSRNSHGIIKKGFSLPIILMSPWIKIIVSGKMYQSTNFKLNNLMFSHLGNQCFPKPAWKHYKGLFIANSANVSREFNLCFWVNIVNVNWTWGIMFLSWQLNVYKTIVNVPTTES